MRKILSIMAAAVFITSCSTVQIPNSMTKEEFNEYKSQYPNKAFGDYFDLSIVS